MAVVKRIPLGEKVEKVVVEQAVTVSGGIDKRLSEGKSIFQTSPYRTMAQTSTWQLSLAARTFSCPGLVQSLPIFQNQCSLLLRKNIRNIKLQSLSQISKHESIALVIRSNTHHTTCKTISRFVLQEVCPARYGSGTTAWKLHPAGASRSGNSLSWREIAQWSRLPAVTINSDGQHKEHSVRPQQQR